MFPRFSVPDMLSVLGCFSLQSLDVDEADCFQIQVAIVGGDGVVIYRKLSIEACCYRWEESGMNIFLYVVFIIQRGALLKNVTHCMNPVL